MNILYENIREIITNDNTENISKICDIMKDKIKKVENLFIKNGILCGNLSKY